MAESYYFGAYWGNRQERVEDCARRTSNVLRDMAPLDAVFGRWFELGTSAEEALQREITIDEINLNELLQRGRSRRETDRTVRDDLGHRIRFWNGREDEESVNFGVKCGSYASTDQVWIPNSCVIDLPRGHLLTLTPQLTLVESVVRNFEPDWAVVNSRLHRDIRPHPEPGVPLVGWITYLSAAFGKIPALPPPARVVVIEPFGSAIVATEERFTAANSEHLELATEIRRVLGKAGLLRRIA